MKLTITHSPIEESPNKVLDARHLTERKRIKADEQGRYIQRDELNSVLDYLDIAIANEFNYEWRDL